MPHDRHAVHFASSQVGHRSNMVSLSVFVSPAIVAAQPALTGTSRNHKLPTRLAHSQLQSGQNNKEDKWTLSELIVLRVLDVSEWYGP